MKVLKFLIFFPLLSALWGCSDYLTTKIGENCEREPLSRGSKIFEYPISTFTQMKDHRAMVSACQIPEDIFCDLNTKELVLICLSYPFLPDYFAFDNPSMGYDHLILQFNGLQELEKREDNASQLLKWILENSPYINKLEDLTPTSVGRLLVATDVAHWMIINDEYFKNLDKEQINTLKEYVINAYIQISINPDVFDDFSRSSLARIYVKALGLEEYKSITEPLKQKSHFINIEILDEIESLILTER